MVTITEWMGTADELAAAGELFCSENPKMTEVMLASCRAVVGKRVVRMRSGNGNILAIVSEAIAKHHEGVYRA